MARLVGMEQLSPRIALRCVDPDRNTAKYYDMWVQADLFCRPSVVCAWGRLGTRGRVAALS